MPPENQRVASLVNYLKQNSAVQVEALRSASIAAGYTEAEFVEAQTIISGQQNQSPESQPIVKKKLPPKIIIILFLLLLILLVSIASYFIFIKSSASNAAVKQTQPSPTADIGVQVAESVNSSDEIRMILSNLKVADYKVTIRGEFTQQFSLALDGMVFYLKKGVITRLDYKFGGEYVYLILSDADISLVDPLDKSYSTFTKKDAEKAYEGAMNALPQLGLAKQDLLWTKVEKNEWQTKSKLKYIFPGDETEYIVKLSVEEKNKLISSMSIKQNETEPWQTVYFTYENLASGVLDSLLVVPSDYQKKQVP